MPHSPNQKVPHSPNNKIPQSPKLPSKHRNSQELGNPGKITEICNIIVKKVIPLYSTGGKNEMY